MFFLQFSTYPYNSIMELKTLNSLKCNLIILIKVIEQLEFKTQFYECFMESINMLKYFKYFYIHWYYKDQQEYIYSARMCSIEKLFQLTQNQNMFYVM